MADASFRSLFAPWLGGACAFAESPPVPPVPSISGGQWYDWRYIDYWVLDYERKWLRRLVLEEDWLEDFILVADDII